MVAGAILTRLKFDVIGLEGVLLHRMRPPFIRIGNFGVTEVFNLCPIRSGFFRVFIPHEAHLHLEINLVLSLLGLLALGLFDWLKITQRINRVIRMRCVGKYIIKPINLLWWGFLWKTYSINQIVDFFQRHRWCFLCLLGNDFSHG